MHYAEYKTILSPKNGVNLYRGCTHGCIYCDSRSACYQMKHDFEDVQVKRRASQILEAELRRKRKPCMIATGAMYDPYIPLENKFELTRQSLALILKYKFGVALQTKSAGVLRDLALLKAIHAQTKAVVQMTLTTYDEDLCRILEPHVSTTADRFEALLALKQAGIPSVVWLCPLLPFINDTEENLLGILGYCRDAQVKGVLCFGFGLTLREGNREYFYQKLDQFFPGLKQRYMRQFGNSYSCLSPKHEALMQIFHQRCAEWGLMHRQEEIFSYLNSFPVREEQSSLWEGL
ncbi:MAG: radical SAM protein [Anaerolineaceae bacterium]|nr:radical SAM protein [Anaerolineaceae bacterium]